MSKESIKYSLKNLEHRKGRSFLTIFSILIGIATIFIFISFGFGLYNYIEEFSSSSSADKLIVQAKGTAVPGLDDTFQLTDDDVDAVRDSAGVLDVSGVYSKVAQVKVGKEMKYTFLVGYDPKKPLVMEVFNIEIEQGRELMSSDSGKVVLGYNYLIDNKIFSKGLELNDNIEVEGKSLRIVGFFEPVGSPPDDAQVYIINDYVEEVYPDENLSYAMIVAKVNIENIDKTIENVEKKLRKLRGLDEGKEDFFVQSFQDMIESYSSALDIVIGFVILIALISVLVSAVNTANTMITSVLERVKEIGIIKSIGARNSEIFKIFLFESAFLGFVAGIIGVIVGFVLSFVGGRILDSLGWGFLSPYFSVWLFVGCIAFATITGGISGVIPAINAMKTNPVDALRYE